MSKLFEFVASFADEHKTAFFSSCAAIIALVSFTPKVVQDYRLYMTYGENGVPQTTRGWLLSTSLRALCSWDLFSTDLYERNDDKRTWLRDDWPHKSRDSRPLIGPHPAPQRQLNQIPSEEAKTVGLVTLTKTVFPLLTLSQELRRQFYALAKKNEKLVQLKPSAFEKQTESMFLADNIQASQIAAETQREISHFHSTSDHSVHLTLSPQDCPPTPTCKPVAIANRGFFLGKKVIESGWGQRHPLDGAKSLKYLIGGTISLQYVLVYAPRDADEIKTVIDAVKASIGYMTQSREVVG